MAAGVVGEGKAALQAGVRRRGGRDVRTWQLGGELIVEERSRRAHAGEPMRHERTLLISPPAFDTN